MTPQASIEKRLATGCTKCKPRLTWNFEGLIMGMFTDFVIAADSEAAAIGESVRPADHWPTLESKGVETIKLATLHGLVTNTPYSNDIQAAFAFVAGNEEDGPWVFKFPKDVQDALADIDEADIPALAARWAVTDEMHTDGWTEEEAARFIVELRAHARAAMRAGHSIFLWLTL